MSFDPDMPAELAAELAAPNVRKLVDPRGVPVRFSRLRAMAKSPAHYFQACQADSDDTTSRKLGRAVHALVLKQPLAVWNGITETGRSKPRAGKDWKEFCAKHAGIEIVNAREFEEANAIAEAVKGHPIAAPMLIGSNIQLELEINWIHPLGRKCASHLDVYCKGQFVADLKTGRDVSPARFGRTVFWDHYHAQLSFYVAAIESLGHPTVPAFVIAVETAPPYPVQVYRLTDAALEAGRKQCHLWLEQLLACELAGSWPAYSQSIVDLDVPEFDTPFVLTVDGEDVQF